MTTSFGNFCIQKDLFVGFIPKCDAIHAFAHAAKGPWKRLLQQSVWPPETSRERIFWT